MKLYVFLVNTGTTLTFDTELAVQSVAELKSAIAAKHRIGVQHQVLVVNGGECMALERRVCSYCAGTDTNPIFLFSKEMIVRDKAPAVPRCVFPAETEMALRVEESLMMPPVLNTVASRSQLAAEMQEFAERLSEYCRTLVHDEHLQHQGWAAIMANLDDCMSGYAALLHGFSSAYATFSTARDSITEQLNALGSAVSVMAQIPLLQSLTVSMSRDGSQRGATAADDSSQLASFSSLGSDSAPAAPALMPGKATPIQRRQKQLGAEQTGWDNGAHGEAGGYPAGAGLSGATEGETFPRARDGASTDIAIESPAGADGRAGPDAASEDSAAGPTTSTQEPFNVTLLDWVNVQDRPNDVETLVKKCLDSVHRLEPAVVEPFLQECREVLAKADNPPMRAIKGLEERLYALDQVLATCRTLVSEQGELAQGFLANQKRAENLNDPSVLPDLCVSHANQLLIMLGNHKKLLDTRQTCVLAKQQLTDNLHVRFRWCYLMMHHLDQHSERLAVLWHVLRGLEGRMRVVAQLSAAPRLYCLAISEVVRRRTFAAHYSQWASALVAEGRQVYESERAKRESFGRVFGSSFLRDRLFRGLQSWPPSSFCTSDPRAFDSELPSISLDDLRLLQSRCPDEVQPYLRLPGMELAVSSSHPIAPWGGEEGLLRPSPAQSLAQVSPGPVEGLVLPGLASDDRDPAPSARKAAPASDSWAPVAEEAVTRGCAGPPGALATEEVGGGLGEPPSPGAPPLLQEAEAASLEDYGFESVPSAAGLLVSDPAVTAPPEPPEPLGSLGSLQAEPPCPLSELGRREIAPAAPPAPALDSLLTSGSADFVSAMGEVVEARELREVRGGEVRGVAEVGELTEAGEAFGRVRELGGAREVEAVREVGQLRDVVGEGSAAISPGALLSDPQSPEMMESLYASVINAIDSKRLHDSASEAAALRRTVEAHRQGLLAARAGLAALAGDLARLRAAAARGREDAAAVLAALSRDVARLRECAEAEEEEARRARVDREEARLRELEERRRADEEAQERLRESSERADSLERRLRSSAAELEGLRLERDTLAEGKAAWRSREQGLTDEAERLRADVGELQHQRCCLQLELASQSGEAEEQRRALEALRDEYDERCRELARRADADRAQLYEQLRREEERREALVEETRRLTEMLAGAQRDTEATLGRLEREAETRRELEEEGQRRQEELEAALVQAREERVETERALCEKLREASARSLRETETLQRQMAERAQIMEAELERTQRALADATLQLEAVEQQQQQQQQQRRSLTDAPEPSPGTGSPEESPPSLDAAPGAAGTERECETAEESGTLEGQRGGEQGDTKYEVEGGEEGSEDAGQEEDGGPVPPPAQSLPDDPEMLPKMATAELPVPRAGDVELTSSSGDPAAGTPPVSGTPATLDPMRESLEQEMREALGLMRAQLEAQHQTSFNSVLAQEKRRHHHALAELQGRLATLEAQQRDDRDLIRRLSSDRAALLEEKKLLEETLAKLHGPAEQPGTSSETTVVLARPPAPEAATGTAPPIPVTRALEPCEQGERVQSFGSEEDKVEVPPGVHGEKEEDGAAPEKMMSQSLSAASPRHSDKISIREFQVGDVVLVVLDERYDNYVLFTVGPTLCFLHADCLDLLGLAAAPGEVRKPWVLGKLVEKEYCQAKKAHNRFRVPLGTKFYRVKAVPWGTTV
ncbi:LOW QUALITY PROTEIN: RB1-inducible coiled-coil protein 1-like [Lethenteron reissneri]|uniref:LOW QUALITY PROTEIN: RB1-inducible coiled-coil protein 1-like n=1 Tax=Lethenteron reissneri TaxID=7753 RepID=UPI002AB6EDE4|nr:LOW QUALITY PROTEIN: RB1-inducible coiled-coil protein 1-like [Lethenteron reissneri]